MPDLSRTKYPLHTWPVSCNKSLWGSTWKRRRVGGKAPPPGRWQPGRTPNRTSWVRRCGGRCAGAASPHAHSGVGRVRPRSASHKLESFATGTLVFHANRRGGPTNFIPKSGFPLTLSVAMATTSLIKMFLVPLLNDLGRNIQRKILIRQPFELKLKDGLANL